MVWVATPVAAGDSDIDHVDGDALRAKLDGVGGVAVSAPVRTGVSDRLDRAAGDSGTTDDTAASDAAGTDSPDGSADFAGADTDETGADLSIWDEATR